ncbi:hypothetical protein HPB49_024067 [Dermacentor silvarum]|uniref:Uncharacterized protein n=1 Tax=Dermacentor silvarum TaxID=543639 RepID=A0ACB8CCB0_DERSI|nr:hypothetical protein HPB49_024067 [Dermacentor silvarum]
MLVSIVSGTTLSGLLVNAHVLVAQHFERRRRTACSLACTICGFYSVVFPSLAELFRSTYGTHGAFLLHGAILMNAIPLAITVRSPPKPILTGDDRHESLYAKDCGASFCALREHTAEARNIESSLNPAEHIGGESSAEDDGVVCATRVSTARVEALSPSGRMIRVSESVRHALKPFLTCTFWIDSLSFSVVSVAMTLFVMISTDYATDKGISTVDAVHLLHAFSLTDIAFRPLAGLSIDFKFLSFESVMLLGFVVQSAAFELLAWYGTFQLMLLASALMGATSGSRIALQAPALVHDFGLENLPILMGAASSCMGVASMLRPPFVGKTNVFVEA